MSKAESVAVADREYRPDSVAIAGREYRPDIDGLRAIAILSVVTYHASSLICPGGYSGVDIFFVISGYLIGGHIYSEILRNQFSWTRFYQRRAKRILPALYAVLIVLTVICSLLLSPFELVQFAKNAFAATVSASNIWLWRNSNYFAPNAESHILLNTWSLGVEEQFYLVIPLVMVLLARIRSRIIFPLIVGLAIVSFALSCMTVHRYPGADFYLLYSRAWELLAGVGLAVYQAQRQPSALPENQWRSTVGGIVGLLLISCPLWILRPNTPFPGWAALPSIAGSVFLIASQGGWINRKLLSLGPLVYIGRISYSWYLWHWPLLALLGTLGGSKVPPAWSFGTIGVAFVCAVLSYYFVERPFRASQLRPTPLLIRYAVVSFLLLALFGAIWKTPGILSRPGDVRRLDAEYTRFMKNPCLVGDGVTAPNLSPPCVDAARPGPELAVWGDSHAAALTPALRIVASKYGLITNEYAKQRCPPLLGAGPYYPDAPARAAECMAFNQHVMDILSANPAIQVVILDAYWEAPFDPRAVDGKLVRRGQDPAQPMSADQSLSLFAGSLRSTIQGLQAAHKRVLVFGDSPVFGVDPAWRIRTGEMPLRSQVARILLGARNPDPGYDITSDNNAAQEESRLILENTSKSIPGTGFWDVRALLCPGGTSCIYRNGTSSLYLDSNHLSLAGERYGLRGFSL